MSEVDDSERWPEEEGLLVAAPRPTEDDPDGVGLEEDDAEREEDEITRLRYLYLDGLVVPARTSNSHGRYTDAQRGMWIQLIRHLIGRGLDDDLLISKLLAMDVRTIRRWMDEAYSYSSVAPTLLTPGQQDKLRVQLMLRAQETSRLARKNARMIIGIDPRGAASLLRAAEEADRRLAELTGISNSPLSADPLPTDGDVRKSMADRLMDNGVKKPRDLLRNVGALMARSMAPAPPGDDEDGVVDVEPEEAREGA